MASSLDLKPMHTGVQITPGLRVSRLGDEAADPENPNHPNCPRSTRIGLDHRACERLARQEPLHIVDGLGDHEGYRLAAATGCVRGEHGIG